MRSLELGQAHHLPHRCFQSAAAAAASAASAAGCVRSGAAVAAGCCEDLEEVKDEPVKPPEAFDNLAMDKRPRVGPLSVSGGLRHQNRFQHHSLVGRGCLETGGGL